MGDAEKRMERAEIAKELRNFATEQNCLLWKDKRGEAPSGIAEVMLLAAAALEEEDKDARRWRAFTGLSASKEYSWCRVVEVQGYSTLQQGKIPIPDAGLEEFLWKESLDAALDDWMEGHSDG